MTKYFCDRCGKEADHLTQIKVPKAYCDQVSTYTTEVMSVCKDCYKEYRRLESTLLPAIVKLKYAMFREFFMNGSDAE